MTISQPGIKSNIFYCHTGLVLMNAIATQDCDELLRVVNSISKVHVVQFYGFLSQRNDLPTAVANCNLNEKHIETAVTLFSCIKQKPHACS